MEWPSVNSDVIVLGGAKRPAAKAHTPLPPFDPDDAGGEVHRVPPPELVIPTGRDLMFLRADFNGVCVDLDRFKISHDELFSIKGANTTPLNMLMTPMLPLYSTRVIDAVLTEHAERGYTHLIWDPQVWNAAANGRYFSPDDAVRFARYVQSWGFYVVAWQGDCSIGDPYLQKLERTSAIDWWIIGGEVDRKMTSEQYDAIVKDNLHLAQGIPCGAHFTMNWPEGFPRDTFVNNWADYNGRLHLMWQANQDEPAGTQAARLYYARQRVALGSFGGDGRPSPDSRVYAFETMATNQLYGRCSEEDGCLRSLELLYATRNDDRIPPMSGSGNGIRLPDGRPL